MKINWKKFSLRVVQGILVITIPFIIGVGYGILIELSQNGSFVEAFALLLLVAVSPAILIVTVSYINDKIKGA